MRGFSLDGNGFTRRGSAALSDTDISLSYEAASRRVIRHPDGRVVGDDIFEVLEAHLDDDPTSTWVGYLGYASRSDFTARPAESVPDAVWMRCPMEGLSAAQEPLLRRSPVFPARPRSSPMPDSYTAAFEEVQRRLRAGDSYEVNLTRRVILNSSTDPDDGYEALCAINPAPFAAHVWHGGTHLLSASPESFVSIFEGHARTKPIKGTTPRDADPEADLAAAKRLVSDPRYRAENLMITDLIRNDLSQVCRPGSVEVTTLMQVESYPAVHQLVSTIEGDLNPETSVVATIRALFPAGSMTGAPKRRTMSIIDAVEETPRGIYAGAVGWISADACELSVVIRSLVRDPAGVWLSGTGGGITTHSDADSEWAESEWKLRRLVSAVSSS